MSPYINASFKEFVLVEETNSLLEELDFFEAGFVQPYKNRQMYIDPKTGKNWRAADKWRQLQAVVTQQGRMGVSPSRIWVSFSDVPKVGYRMQVKSSKSTPVGVFGYPATYVLEKQGNVETFNDRPYILVFKTKGTQGEVGTSWKSPTSIYGSKNTTRYGVKDSIAKLRGKYKGSSSINPSDEADLELHRFTMDYFERYVCDNGKYEYHDDNPEVERRKTVTIQANKICKTLKTNFIDEITSNSSYDYETGKYNYAVGASKVNTDDILKNIISKGSGDSEKKLLAKLKYADVYNPETGNYEEPVDNFKIEDGKVIINLKQSYIDQWNKNPDSLKALGIEDLNQGVSPRQFYHKLLGWGYVPSDVEEYIDNITSFSELQNNSGQNAKDLRMIIDAWGKKLEQVREKIVGKIEEKDEDDSLEKMPAYQKLNAIAQEYDLDLEKAVKQAVGKGKDMETGQQSIYRITQALAQQAQEKLGRKHYHALWNKFLRSVGWDSAMDTHHTSGIHSGEPTQGVFMDMSKVELITVIDNKSHLDGRDATGRPTDSDWNTYDNKNGEHSRTSLSSREQRKGAFANDYESPSLGNMGSLDQTTTAMTSRLNDLLPKLRKLIAYGGESDADWSSPTLTQTIKLVSTALKISKFRQERLQKLGKTEPTPTDKLLSRMLLNFAELIMRSEKTEHEFPPVCQQQLHQLRTMFTNNPAPKTIYGPKASQKYGISASQDSGGSGWDV